MSKPRKIYKRQGIVHICFAGSLYAPLDSEASKVDRDLPIHVDGEFDAETIEGVERDCIKVFQAVPKKKGVREFWYSVEIPAKREASEKATTKKAA